MKTQYQAVDDPVLISIRKYIMKRAIKERGNHACLIWRSMFYFGHRIAILSTNNPIIKKTDASPRFVKRRGNLSILQHYLQNHLHCSQLLNKINFTDLMASAFNTLNFTVRNDVLLSDSKLLFRNQQSPHHEDGEFKALIKTLLHLQLSPTIINCYHTLQKVAQGLRDWHGHTILSII